jgi:hypothetical protein
VAREELASHPATAIQIGTLVITGHRGLTKKITRGKQSGNPKALAINTHFVTLDVPTAATMKTDVFCDMTQCSLAMFYPTTRRHIIQDNNLHEYEI